MKTLYESIFDDEQTYINKSGEMDPLDIIDLDKEPYNVFFKWMKDNKLYPDKDFMTYHLERKYPYSGPFVNLHIKVVKSDMTGCKSYGVYIEGENIKHEKYEIDFMSLFERTFGSKNTRRIISVGSGISDYTKQATKVLTKYDYKKERSHKGTLFHTNTYIKEF